ncbi:2-dehydro-3-deoxyphosphogluconate aldolase/(4S)-4-hydroxy-2-oxoglutarate aldolase [Pseudochrobactrum saccharolyticum]|uniref:2-dehydro-3-deoxy-phosphogluconate aldolase n=1 Tax=Pseudochrobactrum saccharolyticum TaxID=354352 RepID=A0A7W8EQI9_9HYPH|nr:2-dehydro-3-deoxy-phosphogluconate aldolase [Pseudochrobactrum saccharolyticum]KAB0537181.1 2-dehydro-3-deoxy-phosphogluconate aldolase [Pseudochrobactrum saccharolyticum]MBB5092354.1 2-dehydro-3-deoxyphosphogluconate aldolase/(4S)-4-hydroxy-2-oxoglutarate aldolase [Pseudochrobactrum saccharolyticum]
MSQKTESLIPVMTGQTVIPVLLVDKAADAVPLARALAKGGLPAIEITLRTSAALDAIRAVAEDVPEAIVGAGTILNAAHYEQAVAAGSKFIVSPGVTDAILKAADNSPVPLLPGCATASEVMSLRERGYTHVKFFPAEQAGGAAYLKALSSPLAGTFFCPTGGISLSNAMNYLTLPNVLCIGGSWIAPKELVNDGKWDEITALAAAAAALKS